MWLALIKPQGSTHNHHPRESLRLPISAGQGSVELRQSNFIFFSSFEKQAFKHKDLESKIKGLASATVIFLGSVLNMKGGPCGFNGYKIYSRHGGVLCQEPRGGFPVLNAKCTSAFLSRRWTGLPFGGKTHQKGRQKTLKSKAPHMQPNPRVPLLVWCFLT